MIRFWNKKHRFFIFSILLSIGYSPYCLAENKVPEELDCLQGVLDAKALGDAKKFGEAIESGKKLLAQLEQNKDTSYLGKACMSAARFNLANAYLQTRHFAEVLPLASKNLNECLKDKYNELGDSCEKDMEMIAEAYLGQNKLVQAEPYYKKAIGRLEKGAFLKSSSKTVINGANATYCRLLNNYAVALAKAGRYNESYTYITRAADEAGKRFGKNSPDTKFYQKNKVNIAAWVAKFAK